MVELLAPAGSREALLAAIEAGANAVYLAGTMFGARAYADNFDEEGLREAIRLAHLRNVLINVTVNTIVDDQELTKLKEYLKFLYDAGADAVLVQDMGVARVAHEVAPGLPLHASTQMTVHNLDGVRALEKLGFSRVVLSRELSLEAIRHICANAKAEIEVFVHGALCVCYSGQCLMSSIIGGRSGNRGRCAQPCRLSYSLIDEKGNDLLGDAAGRYLLSPRDINTIELLPQLIDAGVASLKIEGRMKRPEYVAIVVDSYRRAIDSYYAGRFEVEAKTSSRLAQIFNRDFTTAFMEKKQGRNMMSDKRPNNRGLMLGRVLFFDKESHRAVLKLSAPLAEGDQVDFWVKVGGRVTANVKDMKLVMLPADSGKKGKSGMSINALKKAVSYGQAVADAEAGMMVSLPVDSMVFEHDRVFKVYDNRLMSWAGGFFKAGAPVRRIPLKVRVSAAVGEPFRIEMLDADGNTASAETVFIGQQARNRPLDYKAVEKQISRLGSSIFELTSLEADLGNQVMVPVSEINEVRRKAVESLERQRLQNMYHWWERTQCAWSSLHNASSNLGGMAAPVRKTSGTLLSVTADDMEKLQAAIQAGADWLIFGGDSYRHEYLMLQQYQQAALLAHKAGRRIAFNTQRIIRDNELEAFHKWLQEAASAEPALRPDAICVHNIGSLQAVTELTDIPVHAEYSFIGYNHQALEFMASQGIESVTLSPELNMAQLEAIARKAPLALECLVDGYLELMVSEYCCTGSFLGGLDKGSCGAPCVNSGKRFFLKDRKDVAFPLVMDQSCHMHLLNANRLSMLPHANKLVRLGISRLRIDGRYLEVDELKRTIRNYRRFMATEGELNEEYRAQAEKLEGKVITRGHYFRGVL